MAINIIIYFPTLFYDGGFIFMPKNVVTASEITNTEAEQPKHHTLYDDVFKTMCTYMLPLLIPVVNELFGTNYCIFRMSGTA